MYLFLTGADISLSESGENSPQNNCNKSLGGFVSSTLVPNNSVNSLFDSLSIKTLNDRRKETIAIALVNKLDYNVKNVKIKIINDINALATFKIAAVDITNNVMEKIANRYEQPFNAEFYDASFVRAGVNIEIINPADVNEEFIINPFEKIIVNTGSKSYENTYNSIYEAFLDSDYNVTRISETVFRIEKKTNEEIIEEDCSFLTSGNLSLNFLSKYRNDLNNTRIIKESTFEKDSVIGIWISREIKNNVKKTNEEIINNYNSNVEETNVENYYFIFEYEKDEIIGN